MHVHVTGWHLTPDFALTRGARPIVVRQLLAEVAARIPVRVLLWAGAPLAVLRPWRGDVRKIRETLIARTQIQCTLDGRERPLHCHHEKTIVIDDRIAFVGGIDLTSFNGDRWDGQGHPARGAAGWHDVAARIAGPAVRDAADNFAMRWEATTGEVLPPVTRPSPAGDIEVQLVRTVPNGMYRMTPRGDFRLLESYLRALRTARRFIYLENQYLWSPEVIAILRDKLRRPPSADFRLLLLLPATPDKGADDTRGQLGTLVQADGNAGRLLACTLYAVGADRDWPVYVHAKVGIADDTWMTIGSANLKRLWAEHLQRPIDDLGADPATIIDTLWKPIAHAQAERHQRGERATHRLTILPHVSRSSRSYSGRSRDSSSTLNSPTARRQGSTDRDCNANQSVDACRAGRGRPQRHRIAELPASWVRHCSAGTAPAAGALPCRRYGTDPG